MSYDSSDGSAIPNVTLDINNDISIVIEKDKYNNFMFHILYISLLLNLTHMAFILTLYISNTFSPKYA